MYACSWLNLLSTRLVSGIQIDFWPYTTLTGQILGSRYCLDANSWLVTAANSAGDRVRRPLAAIEHCAKAVNEGLLHSLWVFVLAGP